VRQASHKADYLMGLITKTLALPDTQRITYSGWVYVRSTLQNVGGGYTTICRIGDQETVAPSANFQYAAPGFTIYLIADSSGIYAYVTVLSRHGGATASQTIIEGPNDVTYTTVSGTAVCLFTQNTYKSYNAWHHIFVAVDLTNYIQYPEWVVTPSPHYSTNYFESPTAKLFVDGLSDLYLEQVANMRGAVSCTIISPSGSINGVGNTGKTTYFQHYPEWPLHSTPYPTAAYDTNSPLLQQEPVTIDRSWTIPIADKVAGIPFLNDDTHSENPGFILAETQIWLNAYIDPTLHIAKFVDIVSGKPVNPSIPRTTFGAPDMLFRRKASMGWRYENNQGTAGEFTKIGTIGDFAPGP
jgi:hypothetical protein